MKDPFYGRMPYNLLLVQMSSLAEIVHALPAFGALKRKYPKTRYYWLADARYKPLLGSFEGLEQVITFDRPTVTRNLKSLDRFWKAIGFIVAFIRILRNLKFSIAVVFQSLFRSTFFSRAGGARVRLGFNRWAQGSWFGLTNRVSVPKKQHVIMKNLELLKGTGLDQRPNRLAIPLGDEVRKKVMDFLEAYQLSPDQVMAICPAASQPAKQWTVEGYAALADRIVTGHGLTPLILCGPGEEAMGKKIFGAMKQKGLVGAPLDLPSLAAALEMVQYVVAPDTGPLHLAAAMGTPVVGLYGPTDPELTGPFWEPHQVLRHSEARTLSSRKQRKMDEPSDSMKALLVDDVYAACETLWQSCSSGE